MAAPVLDAHALMVYLERGEGFDTVKQAFARALTDDEPLSMTVVSAGEVLYFVRRERGPEVAAEIESVIRSLPIDLVDVSFDLARAASLCKVEGGLTCADCFAAALARKLGTSLLTGDPGFAAVQGEIDIHWVGAAPPRRGSARRASGAK